MVQARSGAADEGVACMPGNGEAKDSEVGTESARAEAAAAVVVRMRQERADRFAGEADCPILCLLNMPPSTQPLAFNRNAEAM